MSKKGKFNVRDAGFVIGVNVKLTQIDKQTGHVIQERQGHNRCLKTQLMGLTKFLNGEFNPSQSYLVSYDWIPRYLGVGTNTATGQSSSVTTRVSINDTRLLNEISPRLALPERNTIINRSTQSYVQLAINTYLPEGWYVGETIAEAGLFANQTGNNCLFRITFEGIPITADSIVEVSWVISLISVDSENQPYVETEKDDLLFSMERILDKVGELYPDVAQAMYDFKTTGLYEYGRTDSTQETIDAATALMNENYNQIKDLDPQREIREATALTDEINGEVV